MDIPPELRQIIGKTVRGRRILKGMSIETLSEESSLDDKHIGRIERGEANITIETLYKLSLGLGLKSLLELLIEADQEVYQKHKKEIE